jgi:hypothetical protein
VFADATRINTVELIQPHLSANGLITAIAKSSPPPIRFATQVAFQISSNVLQILAERNH